MRPITDEMRLAIGDNEELTAAHVAAGQREARRQAERASLERRHDELRAIHPEGVIADLLSAHGPRAEWRYGMEWLECHGCPSFTLGYDEDAHHEWPCPTWQTISGATP